MFLLSSVLVTCFVASAQNVRVSVNIVQHFCCSECADSSHTLQNFMAALRQSPNFAV